MSDDAMPDSDWRITCDLAETRKVPGRGKRQSVRCALSLQLVRNAVTTFLSPHTCSPSSTTVASTQPLRNLTWTLRLRAHRRCTLSRS